MKKQARVEKELFKAKHLVDTMDNCFMRDLFRERLRVLEWVLSDLDRDLD